MKDETKEEEVWKAIPLYEGLYEASNLGRIRSLNRSVEDINGRIVKRKGKVLKGCINSRGYHSVTLCKGNKHKSMRTHVLIAITFLNHTPDGMNVVVDHVDNTRLNNHINNLQLITNRENLSKDKVNKSSGYTGVAWHKPSNKWQSSITIKTYLIGLGTFDDEVEAANAYQCALANQDLLFRNKGRHLPYRFYTDDIQPELNDYIKVG